MVLIKQQVNKGRGLWDERIEGGWRMEKVQQKTDRIRERIFFSLVEGKCLVMSKQHGVRRQELQEK